MIQPQKNRVRTMITFRVFIFLCIFLGLKHLALSQACTGNLGENIFTDGDFGTGTPNIVQINPQIAPGYTYNRVPPPGDGDYLLTNYTGNWAGAYDNWLKIGDNSTDPEGYMMVVNADYTPGLFYRKVIDGLCENTLYTFSADIINLIASYSNMIKPDVSFLLDGVVMYSTGEIDNDEQWNTYGFTFTTASGQNSVTLSLQNNAPGGLGNDLALDNISFRACGPEALILPNEVANICANGNPVDLVATIVGDQFPTPFLQWQQSFDEGLTWVDMLGETNPTITHSDLTEGNYYYRYLLANGAGNLSSPKCRIVSNEKIIRVVPVYHSFAESICEGMSVTIGNSQYNSTGIYQDTLVNSVGCDSIITLNLTVFPDQGIEVDLLLNNPTCSYLNNGWIELDQISNAYTPFLVSINNQSLTEGDVLNDLSGGDYLLTITDHYGCQLDSLIKLETPEPFVVDLGDDLDIGIGEQVHLVPVSSDPVSHFQWRPASLIDCAQTCWELSWSPPESMFIYLTATNDQDCLTKDSVYVQVDLSRKIYFPSAFSPNGDGLNDYFTVFGAVPHIQLIKKMIIADRWGEIIFQQEDLAPNIPNLGWDGTFKGKKLSPGAFVYQVEVLFLDNQTLKYSGTFSLIR